MRLFNLGRIEGFPSQYASHKWPVLLDVTETILILAFVIIGIAYLCVILGYSKKRSIYMGVKVTLSLLIGCFVMVENFGQEWEIGSVKTTVPYRAGEPSEIESIIGLKIGLRSVNITLKGEGEKESTLAKETINYNERFPWTWDQGRFGFGLHAGLLQRSYRDAQRRGLPIPILWVAEYFTIDGEGIRFGRFYRTAGWYCHILLWAAFATWILANIFLQTVGRYAAYLTGITGVLQLLSCIVWTSVHNPTPLVIPFHAGVLRVSLGQHFWMALISGILCCIFAVIMIFLDLRYPDALSAFLGIDPLAQYDEYVLQFDELQSIMGAKRKTNTSIKMIHLGNSSMNDNMVVLKRRSTIKNAQKSLFRSAVPVNINDNEDAAIYENEIVERPSRAAVQERSAERDCKPPVPKKVKGIKVIQ